MTDVTNTNVAQSNWIVRFASNLKQRLVSYREYRKSVDELSELSDRELADLGLSRSEIRRAAYEAAYH